MAFRKLKIPSSGKKTKNKTTYKTKNYNFELQILVNTEKATRNITQGEIAQEIGINAGTFSSMVTGKRLPTGAQRDAINAFFGKDIQFHYFNSERLIQLVDDHMKIHKVCQKEIAAELQICEIKFCNIVNGVVVPDEDEKKRIETYFKTEIF